MILVTNEHVHFEYDERVKIIMIDLFAGAGGVTTGAEKAMINDERICRVIAAVNHDRLAIESHMANHPNTYHFIEDIKTISIIKLAGIVSQAKKAFPNALLVIWASLECTNFSKAKGGLPREADSRTLANFLLRYMDLNADAFLIENVQEFMSWGPLDENGRPESMKEGRDYLRWVSRMQSYGYAFDWRLLNSANFGAYTSRTRYFAQFVKPHLNISWPDITHAKDPEPDMFSNLKKWKPVREVLDLKDEGNSVFNRKKDLSPKTFERIYAGLVKFVAGGDDSFISKYYSGKPQHKNISIDGPAATVKTIDGQALVKAVFIQKYNSTHTNGSVKHSVASVNDPAPTVTTQVRMNLIQAFLMQYHGKGTNVNIEGPATTLTTRDRLAVIKTQWIDRQFTSGGRNQSIEKPAGSLLSVPKMSLVTAPTFKTQWIDRQFTSGWGQSIERPAGSILSEPKMSLVTAPFLIDQSFRNKAKSIEDPAPTVLACRKAHYLVNPQYNNKGASIDNPCFTLIARMDKMPPYLVTTSEGDAAIVIYDTDPEIVKKVKFFMAEFGIIDIRMRMLNIPELKKIMGFPESYQLMGSQANQKKFIGNAVETTTAAKIIEAFALANISSCQLKTA